MMIHYKIRVCPRLSDGHIALCIYVYTCIRVIMLGCANASVNASVCLGAHM